MKLVKLGVLVDSQLSFKQHINVVVTKAHNYESRPNTSMFFKP